MDDLERMDKSELHQYIEKNAPNICQIVAYRNGKEFYADEWNGYKRDDCVHIASATKSVTALLVGIAIDRGMIGSVEDKVLPFFPEYAVKRGEKTIYDVTIRHLLTMTAPYKCKGDPWTRVCSSEDWTKASLDLLGGRKGLTGEFNYQTVCLHILTGILHRATGMKPVEFANRFLFAPLGIKAHESFFALTAEEHKRFTVSKAPKEPVWFADPQGLGTPGYGLCLSAEDMAKIGQLCLDGGAVNGEQVISSRWLQQMTAPACTTGERFGNMGYGYLWWILDESKPVYAAIGDGGNVIYVDRESNLTIAVTSYFKPSVRDRIEFIETKLKPELQKGFPSASQKD